MTHNFLAALQVVNGVVEVLCESEGLTVVGSLDIFLDLFLGAFTAELKGVNFSSELEELKIDLSGLTEVVAVFGEHFEFTEVDHLAIEHLFTANRCTDIRKPCGNFLNKFKVHGFEIKLAHLGDELSPVQHEKLNISVAGVSLVTEESDEKLEALDQFLGLRVLHEVVDGLQGIFGDLIHTTLARFLECIRFCLLSLGVFKLTNFVSEVVHGLLLGGDFSMVLGVLISAPLLVLSLFSAHASNVSVDTGSGLSSVLPVVGLELGDVEHLLLALGALVGNELDQLISAHSIESAYIQKQLRKTLGR